MSSASGFQRKRRVSAATLGNGVRPEVTSGATTGKMNTPASRHRRAVITNVALDPSNASNRRTTASSSSWLSSTISRCGPRAKNRCSRLTRPLAEPRAEAQREHLAQRVKAPRGNAEPIDAAAECGAQPMTERRRQHRLAAAARTDERDARRSRCIDRARERLQLGFTALHSDWTRRKNRVSCFFSQSPAPCDAVSPQHSTHAAGRSNRCRRGTCTCRAVCSTESRVPTCEALHLRARIASNRRSRTAKFPGGNR